MGTGTSISLQEWLAAAPRVLADVPAWLPSVGNVELPALASAAAGAVGAARAVQAALVLEADTRGIIAESDHPRIADWVAACHADAGTPVANGALRALRDFATVCGAYDVTALKDAVIDGSVGIESAAQIATTYRRLREKTLLGAWDAILDSLMDVARQGFSAAQIRELEDLLLSQYGKDTDFTDGHQRAYDQREFSALTRNPRTGMFQARLYLDPTSAASLIAALNALTAPRTDPDTGEPDTRTPGMRRADALTTMARHATNPDRAVRGTGSAARIVITIPLAALLAGLAPLSLADQLGLPLSDLPTVPPFTGSTTTLPAATDSATAPHDATGGHGTPRTNGSNGGSNGSTRSNRSGGGNGSDGTHRSNGGGGGGGSGGIEGSGGNRGSSGAIGDRAPMGGAAPSRNAFDLAALGAFSTDGSRGTPQASAPVGGGCAITGYGQVLTPEAVRMLACDAQIIPAILGAKSELLDLGRARRTVSPGLAAAIELRDAHCSYPGCTVPSAWTHKHHIVPWYLGGITALHNMTQLCVHHHHVVHRYGHTAAVTPHGVRWMRADSTPIGNTPRTTGKPPRRTSDPNGRGCDADAGPSPAREREPERHLPPTPREPVLCD